jgi:hypothetical protein
MKRRKFTPSVRPVAGQKDRNRFTAAERRAYLKYQEVPAGLPEGWLTRFEFGDAVGLMSNEAHLHYPEPIWAAAFETVRLQYPSRWHEGAGCAPIALPLVIAALVTTAENLTLEDQDRLDAPMAAKEWLQKVLTAVEAHWIDPEPTKVFAVEINDRGETFDVAEMVEHAHDTLARVLAIRGRPETLDQRYRKMIEYKGRDYADRTIAHLRAIGALGPRPALHCTAGETMIVAREDYATLVAKQEFACNNPDCECAGRGKAETPSWEELVEDGFVEAGQVAVHVRSEQAREGGWVLVAFYGNPCEVESGEFSDWLADHNRRYGFKISEGSAAPVRSPETDGASEATA